MKYLVISSVTLLAGVTLYLLEDTSPLLTSICNYLPDGLWAASLMSFISFLWQANRKEKLVWYAVAIISMFGFELAQHLDFLSGEGDIIDCFVYLASSILIILCDKLDKSRSLKY